MDRLVENMLAPPPGYESPNDAYAILARYAFRNTDAQRRLPETLSGWRANAGRTGDVALSGETLPPNRRSFWTSPQTIWISKLR